MYVCVCNAVRDRDLRQAAQSGCGSFRERQALTKVATCCGRCEPLAREVFGQALDRAQPQPLDQGGLAVQPA